MFNLPQLVVGASYDSVFFRISSLLAFSVAIFCEGYGFSLKFCSEYCTWTFEPSWFLLQSENCSLSFRFTQELLSCSVLSMCTVFVVLVLL